MIETPNIQIRNYHNNVINRNIVYCDEPLSLNEETIVSSIYTNEDYLEKALRTIVNSNHEVTFYLIQYSPRDRKLYFYTDKEIEKKELSSMEKPKYKPLENVGDIIQEINDVINPKELNTCIKPANIDEDENIVSLYTITKLIRKVYKQNKQKEKEYEKKFNDKLEIENTAGRIRIHSFDYDSSTLIIEHYYRSVIGSSDKIYLKKDDGDLYISDSESSRKKSTEIFSILCNELSQAYDEFMKLPNINTKKTCKIIPLNSNFLVQIDKYDVSIINGHNSLNADFVLSASRQKDGYNLDSCNSQRLINEVEGKEEEMFKKIFVNIEDCPEWARDLLYEIRQKELNDDIEEENYFIDKSTKKQKRKNKILGFLRK